MKRRTKLLLSIGALVWAGTTMGLLYARPRLVVELNSRPESVERGTDEWIVTYRPITELLPNLGYRTVTPEEGQRLLDAGVREQWTPGCY